MESIQVQLDQGFAKFGDMRRLPGAHQHIALVPQWDFLDLIADAAEAEPTFTLLRNAEVVDLLRDGDRVAGVRYRDRTDGTEHEIRAGLTVACDGRGSRVREAAGLHPRGFGVPMDVWWFRLPRHGDDPEGGVGRVSAGHFMVMIDRGDYWQCAYLIGKGTDEQMRAEGLDGFRERIARLVPWVAERVGDLASFDDVKLLNVELNRLRKWYVDGLLLIGDAAHAMSPVGGVGINLAVADAVATARILAPALRSGGIVGTDQLRKVQLRRWWPTALIQGFQKLAHRVIFRVRSAAKPAEPLAHDGKVSMMDGVDRGNSAALPLPLRLANRFPVLQGIPARLVGIGPLPEHAPTWARRPSTLAASEKTPAQGS
jgi:2-polyprenyl-6-methoxyphenol hydroxylase-like FAD-dependent oxidoreductase